jgi:phosphoribosylformylglycinamidine cyclo-ligase
MIGKLKSSKPSTEKIRGKMHYSRAGVDTVAEEKGLDNLVNRIKRTTTFSDIKVELPFGYFANVLNLGNVGLAISTDGVGTKIIVAQMMDKYDTIGIDCIAMNVNDILCVGAIPISLVDYIAVQSADPHLLDEIGKGLEKGAEIARISIPGGEIAQIKEMLKSEKEGLGFDLVGTAVGLVPLDKIIYGQDISEGDILLGLRSSGIHSNGLTLARKVLFEQGKYKVDKYIDEIGATLGEELLKPTYIYVPEVVEMLKSGIRIKALIHITSDGFLNLNRVKADCGYIIEKLPEPQPIFRLIQKIGEISDEEMFRVYNMGIGFCIVVPESEVNKVFDICKRFDIECFKIGRSTIDIEKTVIIEEKKLIGKGNKFSKF